MIWGSLTVLPLIKGLGDKEDLELALLIANLMVRQVFFMSDWNLISSAS